MQTIVVKEVGKEPTKLNVRDGQLTLELLQRLVGGYIEVVHPDGAPDDVVMVCNEEGKIKELPFNFFVNIHGYTDAICGTAVFCAEGINADGELDLVPLTEMQADNVLNELRKVEVGYMV